MIENVVFVLGAGASCPYGFPSGRELRKQICSSYVHDYEHYLKAKRASQPFISEELIKAKRFVDKFRKSSTSSIDLFIARNPEFSIEGKRAIIFRILIAEGESHFREGTPNRNQDWYTWLFEQMTDKLVLKEDYSRFNENDVSFITFNYDRSLEHFLYDSLVNSFSGIPYEKIIEQLNQIKICHVFGQMGPLEWQGQDGQIEYRVNRNVIGIDDLRENIKIVYEEGESPKLKEAKELISKAHRVIFLGFGYAKENLDALKIPEILADVQRVSGTALGLTSKQKQRIESLLRVDILGKSRDVYIKDKDCLALLREVL